MKVISGDARLSAARSILNRSSACRVQGDRSASALVSNLIREYLSRLGALRPPDSPAVVAGESLRKSRSFISERRIQLRWRLGLARAQFRRSNRVASIGTSGRSAGADGTRWMWRKRLGWRGRELAQVGVSEGGEGWEGKEGRSSFVSHAFPRAHRLSHHI
jgi:hypothetical protein